MEAVYYNMAIIVSIIIVIYLAAFVLMKSDSSKRIWYFVTLVCTFMFLLGDLLGKTSGTVEGAFFGTKVEYLGSAPLTTALLLFVIDFCAVKMRRLFKILLWVIPVGVIILLWTTEQHGLIYSNVDFSGTGLQHLVITPGPLHLVVHIYSLVTAVIALVILTSRLIGGGWGSVRRLNFFLLILGVLIPVVVNVFYVLKIIPINATPLFLSASCIVFFFNTVQYNMLDILPLAAKLALRSITEAFVLVDARGAFLNCNAAAYEIFPELLPKEPGAPMDDISYWPFKDIEGIDYETNIPFDVSGEMHFVANISTIRNKQHLLGYIVLITDITEIMTLRLKAEQQSRTIMDGIAYAAKIQRNLLPPEKEMAKAFSDCSVLWKPRDMVGGDIYWMKRFKNGTVLCVCDCTGHGMPGALLTMLVISALESIVWEGNCSDTSDIILQLDKKLSGILHANIGNEAGRGIMDIADGCDIAVLYIANDRFVRFSTAKTSVFICDGGDVAHYKGQKLFVGEGKLAHKGEVETHNIPASPDTSFYIASDGLSDQIGGEQKQQFGYKQLKDIVLENHDESLGKINAMIWDAFKKHCGNEPQRDDFELISFRP